MTMGSWTGLTVQLWVGNLEEAARWYGVLLGRLPDAIPAPGFLEWEVVPGAWLQVTEGPRPGTMSRLRLGVDDVDAARARLVDELDVDVSQVERLENVAAWANLEDPWGNRLGIFQDLAVLEAA